MNEKEKYEIIKRLVDESDFKKQWRYKISPDYPGYRDFGDNLSRQSAWKHYVTCLSDSLPYVLLLDLECGVRYIGLTEKVQNHSNMSEM